MNKRNAILLMAILMISPMAAICQENLTIEPVWQFFLDNPDYVNPNFPILVADPGPDDGEGCGGAFPGYENTKFQMDLVSTLVRYDDQRLLLFIVENGINEDDPNHNAALADQYPDRSIWWLNAADGKPIGIALEPLKLADGATPFTREGVEYTTIGFWPTSDFFIERALDDRARSFRPDLMQDTAPKVEVDAEGNLYVSDRHMLIRYESNGDYTFKAPTLAFEYPKVNPPVSPEGVPFTDGHYRSWSIKDINISGVGQNKIMTTAGRHWIDGCGIMYYTSSDGGKTFTMKSYKGQEQRGGLVGTGGGCGSAIVHGASEMAFGVGFPGSDRYLYRMERPAGSPATADWVQAVSPEWQYNATDPDTSKSETQRYMSWEMCDVDAAQDVPFVVVMTIPQWESAYKDWTAQGGPPAAWIALISIDDINGDGIAGDYITGYKLPFVDENEPNIFGENFDAATGQAWQNCYQVEVHMDVIGSDVEILASGGGMGFGRYMVKDVFTSVPEWSVY